MIDVSLDGMPPIKKPRKKVVKKFHTTKNVPVEVSVRRQVAEEIGDADPTKDQKFTLLQKYGATAPRIDRLATKPNWMGVSEWKRKQNDWFKATKGLVRPEQRARYRPNNPNSRQSQSPTPSGQRPYQKPKRNLGDPRFPERFQTTRQNRRPDTKVFPRNSGQMQTETLPS